MLLGQPGDDTVVDPERPNLLYLPLVLRHAAKSIPLCSSVAG